MRLSPPYGRLIYTYYIFTASTVEEQEPPLLTLSLRAVPCLRFASADGSPMAPALVGLAAAAPGGVGILLPHKLSCVLPPPPLD